MRITRHDSGERGSALILALVFMVLLIGLTAASLEVTKSSIQVTTGEREGLYAHQAALAAMGDAISRITYGGQNAPATSSWVQNGGKGGYWFSTVYDPSNSLYTITCWGRYPNAGNALAQPAVNPNSPSYNTRGWTMRGIEVIVLGTKNVPNSPLYFGNGGVEKGRGAWNWSSSQNPLDPTTWTSYINPNNDSSADSFMTRVIPMRVSALNHPANWLDAGGGRGTGATGAAPGTAGGPTPAGTPHQYSIWSAQTYVGQQDCASFLLPWTISGTTYSPAAPATPANPLYTGLSGAIFPSPADTTAFPGSLHNPNSPITFSPTAFPVDTTLPDVQTWSWDLWDTHKNSNQAVHIVPDNGSLTVRNSPNGTVTASSAYNRNTTTKTLTIGSPTDPKIVFVSGNLKVSGGWKLQGHGILVVRDDYHPDETPNQARASGWSNTASNNQPSGNTREGAFNMQDGNIQWTGLVMIAGWRPKIDTTAMPAGNYIRVNGALFGEDSVQSGGEISLDSACIQMFMGKGSSKAGDATSGITEITYCRSIFEPGGLIYDLLPEVSRRVISIRDLRVVN